MKGVSQTKEYRRALYAANPQRRAAYQARQKRWRLAHPERARDVQRRHRYKKIYGLTVEQYDSLLARQHGQCAICGTSTPRGRYNKWHIDHDHVTNEIRGILCNKCNAGLGFFKDDAELLRAALKYLLPSR